MIRILQLIFLTTCLVTTNGCGNPKTDKKEETENTQPESEPKNENLEKLGLESSRLRGGGSIKLVGLEGGKGIIQYVKDYEEYKELNPQSSVTKSSWEGYWENSAGVEKALVDGSVRLMKKLDYLDQVEISITYNRKIYSVDVKKSELEKFIGLDFKSIISDWDNTFSNPYVYDDNGRKKFYMKFGVNK